MRSVTEQAALDEFLTTAELAGTDFTAEKLNNVKIIHTDQRNPYLLSAQEERSAVKKQNANKSRLTVPRRPPWDETTTRQELDARERASLLEWRRGLAELQESNDLLMTPFERNLEVWRQLWRVIERSDLVVQIVDARNPLLFRSEDLERYVKEVDPTKENLLLVNKADMMTLRQRSAWAEHFEEKGIQYTFFSAELAKELNEARGLTAEGDGEEDGEEEEQEENGMGEDEDDREDEDAEEDVDGEGVSINVDGRESLATQIGNASLNGGDKIRHDTNGQGHDIVDEEAASTDDSRTRILTVDELEALFLERAPKVDQNDPENPRKTQIGLVGYPNVGKSSTINALIGAKKVSVSSTPGKTKHFQTIHLSPEVILCDCPGLVFPNFATTKAELVCNGILPIDQLREFTGPAGLVAQRIPQTFFEAMYGVKVYTRPIEEGGTGIPTAEEILTAYAVARGFATTGQGQPDQSRAARYILKDYVSGKLLFCHPPPHDPPFDTDDFNSELYDLAHLPHKRRATISTHLEPDDSSSLADVPASFTAPPIQGPKSRRLDSGFFGPGQNNVGRLTMPFNYKYSEQGAAASGRHLTGRKQRAMIALERNMDPADVKVGNGKKHFKGRRKGERTAVEEP